MTENGLESYSTVSIHPCCRKDGLSVAQIALPVASSDEPPAMSAASQCLPFFTTGSSLPGL